jgi:hypothetical protein
LKLKEAGGPESREQGLYRYQAKRTRNQKMHVFTGERKQVKKPKSAPAWMPDKIWKLVVKKVGMEKLEDLETTTAKVVVVKRRK